MHRFFAFRSSVGWLKLRRPAIVAGLLTGMALLVACGDTGAPALTAPPSLRNATTSTGTYGNGNGHAARIIVCVDASSPAGTYKFRNSSWNSGLALPGYGVNVGGTWYDQGDGGDAAGAAGGATDWFPAKYDNSEYTVAVGGCVV